MCWGFAIPDSWPQKPPKIISTKCDCYEFSHVPQPALGRFASQTGKELAAVRELFLFGRFQKSCCLILLLLSFWVNALCFVVLHKLVPFNVKEAKNAYFLSDKNWKRVLICIAYRCILYFVFVFVFLFFSNTQCSVLAGLFPCRQEVT